MPFFFSAEEADVTTCEPGDSRGRRGLGRVLVGILFIALGAAIWFASHAASVEIREGRDRASVGERLTEGMRLIRRGEYEAAEKVYRGVLVADPSNAEALFRMGVLCSLKKDHRGAEAYFRRSVESDGANPAAWRRLGECRMKLGDFGEAAHAFEKAFELTKEREWRVREGVAWLKAGEAGKARRIFEALILDDPGDYHAIYYYGNALLRLGEKAHAARCYAAAIRIRPVLVEAYVNLASIRYGEGRYAEAVRLLEKTLDVAPKSAPFDPAVRYNLGLAAWRAGEREKARENFEAYLRVCPNCPDAAEVKRIIQGSAPDDLGSADREKEK